MAESEVGSVTIAPQVDQQLGEQEMVQRERWEEIRRMRFEQRMSVSAIARRFDLDRKTVRRCLRQNEWRPDRPNRCSTWQIQPAAIAVIARLLRLFDRLR